MGILAPLILVVIKSQPSTIWKHGPHASLHLSLRMLPLYYGNSVFAGQQQVQKGTEVALSLVRQLCSWPKSGHGWETEIQKGGVSLWSDAWPSTCRRGLLAAWPWQQYIICPINLRQKGTDLIILQVYSCQSIQISSIWVEEKSQMS